MSLGLRKFPEGEDDLLSDNTHVGRKTRKAQDGNLGQADSHDGQVPRQGHDGEYAPYADIQCLQDVDTAHNSCGVNKRD